MACTSPPRSRQSRTRSATHAAGRKTRVQENAASPPMSPRGHPEPRTVVSLPSHDARLNLYVQTESDAPDFVNGLLHATNGCTVERLSSTSSGLDEDEYMRGNTTGVGSPAAGDCSQRSPRGWTGKAVRIRDVGCKGADGRNFSTFCVPKQNRYFRFHVGCSASMYKPLNVEFYPVISAPPRKQIIPSPLTVQTDHCKTTINSGGARLDG